MSYIKEVLANINKKEFLRYFLFSSLIIITLIVFASSSSSYARYETNTKVKITPALAFFVVGVESQTGQIKLSSMVPSEEPYLYSFNVSNFNDEGKANVDLTYSIEIITTTNMPLNYRIFRGTNLESNEIDADYYYWF